VSELAAAQAMTTPVSRAYQPGGVTYLPVASFGVVQLDNYNRGNLVMLQRNADDGSLQVQSLPLRYI
jgi:hypothetical protein